MSNPKPQNPSLSLSSPSQFSHTLTKIAVTQILKSVGFRSSKSSALHTLTRLTTLFLQFLSKSASSRANFSCCRTHCNIFDVIHAIEDSSLAFGFPHASNIHQTLLTSKTIDHLRLFLDEIDDFPSSSPPCSLTNFRSSSSSSNSSVIFCGKIDLSKNRGSEIPRWLPQFPELGKVEEGVKVENEKSMWEDTRSDYRPLMMAGKAEKGRKEIVLQGRRERVKFRLLCKRKRNANVDDFELRNGVCRGSKRVGLIKKD